VCLGRGGFEKCFKCWGGEGFESMWVVIFVCVGEGRGLESVWVGEGRGFLDSNRVV